VFKAAAGQLELMLSRKGKERGAAGTRVQSAVRLVASLWRSGLLKDRKALEKLARMVCAVPECPFTFRELLRKITGTAIPVQPRRVGVRGGPVRRRKTKTGIKVSKAKVKAKVPVKIPVKVQAGAVVRSVPARFLELGMVTPMPVPAPEPDHSEVSDKPVIYPVWYGTNRAPVDPDDPSKGYSNTEDDKVRYGCCRVSIPRSHRFGSIGSNFLKRLFVGDDRLCVKEIDASDPEAFWARVQAEILKDDTGLRTALVYIHGYFTSFESAAIRAAQIGYDLKVPGVTAFFSWPSKSKFFAYMADEEAVKSAVLHIRNFLIDVATRSGAKKVHIVAHSMGNRALLDAVQGIRDRELPGVQFGQIFLAAPDVSVPLFKQLADKYPELSERTTLYISDKDMALAASKGFHGGYERVGYPPPVTVVPRIDTVEASKVDFSSWGHGYFSEDAPLLYDMAALIRKDASPGGRLRMTRMRTSQDQVYWQLA
jgi:esterase/lipase superfamily enzyme